MTGTGGERAASRGERPFALLFRLVAVAALIYVFVELGRGRSFSVPALVAGGVGFAAMAALVLADRRLSPVMRTIVTVVMLASGVWVSFEYLPIGWAMLGFAAFNLIGRPDVSLRLAVPPVAVAGAALALIAGRNSPDLRDLLWTAGLAALLGVVSYSRRQRLLRRRQEQELVERSRELEERSREVLAQTERTRAETARAGALEERNRIAREVHDVLAHSLGGLVVQLDAADALLSAGRDPAAVALRVRTSRQLAVEGLREARLAVRELRADDQPTAAEDDSGVAEPGAGRATAATVDLVARLTSVMHGPVGLQLGVEFDVVGEPVGVPEQVAAAFAAVCREGLTNINKHAPGSRSVATVVFDDDGVRMELINGLPESGGADHGLAGTGGIDHGLAGTGGGVGLPGMEQRFAEIGGTVTAGPRGRRWVVSAAWQSADSPAVAAESKEGQP